MATLGFERGHINSLPIGIELANHNCYHSQVTTVDVGYIPPAVYPSQLR